VIYYVVRGMDAVKIGYTERDPISRLKELQTGCPDELRLVGVDFSGGLATEGVLHAQFADAHLRGEWFKLTEPIRRHMKATTVQVSRWDETAMDRRKNKGNGTPPPEKY
jgi:hypothetical protein